MIAQRRATGVAAGIELQGFLSLIDRAVVLSSHVEIEAAVGQNRQRKGIKFPSKLILGECLIPTSERGEKICIVIVRQRVESVTLITLCAYCSQLAREHDEAPDHIKQIPKEYHPKGGEFVTKEDVSGLSAFPIEQPELERISRVWPFQRGIIFLTANPQRARICEGYECRSRFVAPPNKNNMKYCSRSCFATSHRAQNREWWRQNRAKTTHMRASSQRDG